MLLKVDDPTAHQFNVGDAAALAGQRVTVIGPDDVAFAAATVAALSDTAIRLEDREDLAPDQRFRIRAHGTVEARAVRLRTAETRTEQEAFRQRVGEAWGWRCAITGEDVREALEAAHLPGASWRAGDNAAEDGILLRADLHRLLDTGLLRIEGGVVRVSVGGYAALDGREIRSPERTRSGRA
jgi:hypothetical protein